MLSESAQYIPLPDLFQIADRALAPDGRILLADYFVKDDASGPMSRSGHRIGRFDRLAAEHGFRVLYEEDITDRTTPTLDLARGAVDRYVLPSLDIGTEKLRRRRPRTMRLLGWLFRKKIASLREEMALLDSTEFARHKRYRILMLGRTGGSE